MLRISPSLRAQSPGRSVPEQLGEIAVKKYCSGPPLAVLDAMQQPNESELITRGRHGDRQALSELFERHYRSSVRTARRILHSDDEAMDAVQSAYLAAFQHFGCFRGDAPFSAWITRIVKNQCLAYLRRPERRVLTGLEEEGGSDGVLSLASLPPTPENLAWSREIAAVVRDAAETLPRRLQDVYILCCLSGHCVKEAAKMLGLTVPATKTRLFRAQHRMRSEVGRRMAMPVGPKAVRSCLSQTTKTPCRLAA
jgi:RNA polymerase sigma-70 factor (ECF subfamily)